MTTKKNKMRERAYLVIISSLLIITKNTISASADSLIAFSNAIRIFTATLERYKGKTEKHTLSYSSLQNHN